MRKMKILLSLLMMLGISVPIFAEKPQKNSKDCMIPPPPQIQEEIFCDEDMVSIWDIDNVKEKPHFDFKNENNNKAFHKIFFKEKFDKLNLTDKQKEDLKILKKSNFNSKIELEKQIRAKEKALNDELLKEKYSTKEVKNITKEIKNLSAKLIDNKVAKQEGMRKILTSEQYNKLFKVKTHFDILAERLGLSSEQKEKFIKILENKKEKEFALKQQLREKDMLLKKEFNKENIDKNVILKLSEDISNITKELFKLDVDTKIELKSVLTTEQYNNFVNPRPNPGKPIIYEPTAFDKNIDKK